MDLKESSGALGLYGAWVATNDFYKNLLKFGRFDEYHFFADPNNRNTQKGFLRQKGPFFSDGRVKIRMTVELFSFLRNAKDMIFFVSTPAIFNMAHLRN